MAHSCPECGMLCHCGGDIDDCQFDGTREQLMCSHCDDEDTPNGDDPTEAEDNKQFSEPINDIWKDPNVVAALKERSADDIAVLSCPKCGRWGYYNQGSHFWCRFCKQGWYCCSEGEEPPEDGRQYLYLDVFTTLADTVQDFGQDIP